MNNHFSTPLTIDTVNLDSQTSTNSWSPFSSPSFSPFNNVSSSYFQYSQSRIASPSRPIFKSFHNSVMSPARSNVYKYSSPRQISAQQENYPLSPRSLPRRSELIDMTETIRQAAMHRAMGGRVKICTFCKTNGESEQIYSSHALKDANGNVICPILKNYSCPECGASGEKTHTKKYCPKLQKRLRHEMLKNIASP